MAKHSVTELVQPDEEPSLLKPANEFWSLSPECDMPWDSSFTRSSGSLGLILKDNGDVMTLESRRGLLWGRCCCDGPMVCWYGDGPDIAVYS